MSTRCNIVLKLGSTVIYIYRHCDGYPAETGADILKAARDAVQGPDYQRNDTGAANQFLCTLLGARYEKQSYEKEPRAVFELTTGLHGDIEHCYTVEFCAHFNTGPASILHAKRPATWHQFGKEVEDWKRDYSRYSLETFAYCVNADRAAINGRMRELKKENPGSKFYEDIEEYPMVEAPPRFIVQALSTGMGWTDTKHGAQTLEAAKDQERALLADDSAWLQGKRETRIRDVLETQS